MRVSLNFEASNTAVVTTSLLATVTIATWTGWASGLPYGWEAAFAVSLLHLGGAFSISQEAVRKGLILATFTEVATIFLLR